MFIKCVRISLFFVTFPFLVAGCKSGNESVSKNVTDSSAISELDSLSKSDGDSGIELWNEEEALRLLFPDDSVTAIINKVIANVLSAPLEASDSSYYYVAKNVIICLAESQSLVDATYTTHCSKLAVFSMNKDGGLELEASAKLDCYTNYDDGVTNLSLEMFSLNDSIDVIGVTADSNGGNSNETSSASVLLLYTIDRPNLIPISEFFTSESESEFDDDKEIRKKSGSGKVIPSDHFTLGIPDLIYEYNEESTDGDVVLKKEPVRAVYAWSGKGFVIVGGY